MFIAPEPAPLCIQDMQASRKQTPVTLCVAQLARTGGGHERTQPHNNVRTSKPHPENVKGLPLMLVSQAAVAVPLYTAPHVTAVQAVPALQPPEYAPEAVVAAQTFGAVSTATKRFPAGAQKAAHEERRIVCAPSPNLSRSVQAHRQGSTGSVCSFPPCMWPR